MRTANSEQRTANSIIYALKIYLKNYTFVYTVLRTIKRLIISTLFFPIFFPLIAYYELKNLFTGNVIFSKCWIRLKYYRLVPNNWGDDINKYFFDYVSNVQIVAIPAVAPLLPGRVHYSLIGSILGCCSLNNCIVYGSGQMDPSRTMHGKPRKIISVRGPRTRKFLIERSISCPEHYGDPALLLPVFYVPRFTRKEAVSLIPNQDALRRDCQVIDELTEKYGCRLVNMTRYDKWTDIIDSIVASEFVISESLHGLIVAETYGVPCVWAELINHEQEYEDWSFKYLDFYESIGKYGMSSLKLYEGFSFEDILKKKDKWKPGKIDYAELLSLFPFEIKPEFLPRIKKFLPNN